MFETTVQRACASCSLASATRHTKSKQLSQFATEILSSSYRLLTVYAAHKHKVNVHLYLNSHK